MSLDLDSFILGGISQQVWAWVWTRVEGAFGTKINVCGWLINGMGLGVGKGLG